MIAKLKQWWKNFTCTHIAFISYNDGPAVCMKCGKDREDEQEEMLERAMRKWNEKK